MQSTAILLTAVLAMQCAAQVGARTWRMEDGSLSVEATLVDVRDGVARLKKANGTVVSVSLEELCADDLRCIDEVFKASIQRIKTKAASRSASAASAGSSHTSPEAPLSPFSDGRPFEIGPVLPEVPVSGLRCRWQEDLDYPYVFQATVDLGEYVETVRGMIVIQPASDDVPAELRAGETAPAGLLDRIPKEPVRRGSAFVVRPDGYLITSAQLVEKAGRVDVRLGNKSYAARVLALNTRYDLALLRIPATDLRALPLAGIESTRLTDEMYVVGCPDPDARESEPELTRGTLAGIIERSADQVLQMDSGIAKGLLGGPLVNRKAEVIGIAHADIAFGPVSDVGLAVPAQYARRILENKGLRFLERGGDRPMEEAALAEAVRPSVGTVTAVRRLLDTGPPPREALWYYAQWISSVRSKRGFGALPEAIEGFIAEDGEIAHVLVDPFGSVCGTTGDKVLPYFLGKPGQLPLEALSATGEFTWTEKSPVRIKLVHPNNFLKYFRPAGIPILPNFLYVQDYTDPSLHLRQLTEDVHPGVRTTVYEILDSREDVVVVKKRFEVETLGVPGGSKFARVVGEGTVHFDRASGLPQRIETTATIAHHVESTDVEASLTITCRAAEPVKRREFLDVSGSMDDQLESWRREILNAAATASRTTRQTSPNLVLDPILADLRASSEDRSRLVTALAGLSRMIPAADRREEVLDLLEPWTRDARPWDASRALRAMAMWASAEDIPRLLKLVGERQDHTYSSRLQALGQSRLPQMASELARRLATPADQRGARSALMEMGPIAEGAVIEMLEHEGHTVRREACLILRKIGGKASIAALDRYLVAADSITELMAAQMVLKSLKKRHE